ncbi:hypothetical protein [Mycobacteroides abscessus]
MFVYTTEQDGKKIKLSVPKFGEMKSAELRKIRKLAMEDQLFTLLENILSDDDLAVVDEMTMTELGEFYKAWQADSDITSGE